MPAPEPGARRGVRAAATRRSPGGGPFPLGLLALALAGVLATGCASTSPEMDAPAHARAKASRSVDRSEVVRAALAQIGAPYRHGGHSPSGFDCSGLVLYSYRKAGLRGLPHSAAALRRRAEPIPLGDLRPGDLLFFSFVEGKTSHVAIYVGDESFVHAPSSGGQVEQVPFSHVYWSRHLGRAGRLVR